MSESLARHNPQSPFRRAPSVLQKQFSKGGGVYPEAETDELLKMAKDNIKNLKQKGKQVKIAHTWRLCMCIYASLPCTVATVQYGFKYQ